MTAPCEMVAIVDSGGANINSVVFAFQRLDVSTTLTSCPELIRAASHVVLPGVGSADAAMRRLGENGLDTLIPKLTQPVLGICLGMHLLYESSAECVGSLQPTRESAETESAETESAETPCLGVVPGKVHPLTAGSGVCVPHMGWNQLEHSRSHWLAKSLSDRPFMYFVHGFAAPVNAFTVSTARHGSHFTAIVAKDNFVGVQFHPERSAGAGLQLLQNFVSHN